MFGVPGMGGMSIVRAPTARIPRARSTNPLRPGLSGGRLAAGPNTGLGKLGIARASGGGLGAGVPRMGRGQGVGRGAAVPAPLPNQKSLRMLAFEGDGGRPVMKQREQMLQQQATLGSGQAKKKRAPKKKAR